ncbi:hypothetical protein, partial [Klebsiella pneumoniae]|uniref:hypothetical protein n=1 Tax=Klebsiella pneumoniae TaxID=573 RepID=UPI0030132009
SLSLFPFSLIWDWGGQKNFPKFPSRLLYFPPPEEQYPSIFYFLIYRFNFSSYKSPVYNIYRDLK